MKKYWRMKRRFSLCCNLFLFVLLLLIPISVHAEESRYVYEIYHTHSTDCQGVVYYTISADLSSKLSTVDTDQCDLCGDYHDYYEYTASCSCGKTWNTGGHACINSPYGTNQGNCSNYSVVDADTTHLHPVEEYICGKTEETVIESITIEKSTIRPAQNVVVTATASGELESIWLVWKGAESSKNDENRENAVLTINENGIYCLSIIYTDAGMEYVMEKEVVVDNVDNVQPEVEMIVVNNMEFTAESVILSIEARDEVGLPPEYISWNGEAFGDVSQYEVTENGTYEVVIRDMAGNTVTKSITVENIDHAPPQITLLKAEPIPWYSGECTVKVNAIDVGNGNAGSGLAEMAYSWDGGISWTDYASYTLHEAGEVVVMVRDAVGNISTERINVEKEEIPEPAEPSEKPEQDMVEPEESGNEDVGKEPPSENENMTETEVEKEEDFESEEEEESEDETEYQEAEIPASEPEVEVEEVILPEADLQAEEVLLPKPDLQEEKVILPEQSQQEEENVLGDLEIREDDEIQSDMELLSGIRIESNADNVAAKPIAEAGEKAYKTLVMVCASGIMIGGIGFAVVGLMSHILFGMCKVYEVGSQQKEIYLGNVGIRPYKKGYRIILGTDIVDMATGRNLKIKIPSWFVRFKEFKLLQIVVGKEVIDKYIEQNIDIHINA